MFNAVLRRSNWQRDIPGHADTASERYLHFAANDGHLFSELDLTSEKLDISRDVVI